MTKTKKILSIILLTLLILSTVFSICKKIGFCASSDPSPLVFDPPPLLTGSGIGPFDYVSNDVVVNVLSYAMQHSPEHQVWIVLPYYTGNSSTPTRISVFAPKLTNPSIPYISNFIINYYIAYDFSIDGTLRSTVSNAAFTIQSSLVYENVNGVDHYIPFNAHYPVYVYSPELYLDSNGNQIFDNYLGDTSSDDNLDLIQGVISEADADIHLGGEITENMSSSQWRLTLKDWIQGIINAIQNTTKFLYNNLRTFFSPLLHNIFTFFSWFKGADFDGKLDDLIDQFTTLIETVVSLPSDIYSYFEDFFSNFWSNLDDWLEDSDNHLPDLIKNPFRMLLWFYNHGLQNNEFNFMVLFHYLFDFDSVDAYADFSSNKYGDFILDVRSFFSDLFSSITGVTASDRVFFTIELGDHFGVTVPTIEVSFDWYSNIRDTYLPYFCAFLYVSVIWLFFKRLPDIIRGVAGDISSFEDALPKDFENTTYDFSSRRVISTVGTRSRSGVEKSIHSRKM